MEENGLPTTYRDQIADYIVRHTGVSVPMDTSSNPDPFTGGGAYVPSSSAPQPGRSGGGGATASVTGGGVDPFTGQHSGLLPAHPGSPSQECPETLHSSLAACQRIAFEAKLQGQEFVSGLSDLKFDPHASFALNPVWSKKV